MTITKKDVEHFDAKIKELEEAIERLRQRQRDGWRYRKVWRREHGVRAYKVRGHYAMMPVRK